MTLKIEKSDWKLNFEIVSQSMVFNKQEKSPLTRVCKRGIVVLSLFISTQFLMPRLLTDSGTSSKKPAVAHSGTTHNRFLY